MPSALQELSAEESLRLLRAHPVHVGRLAFLSAGRPLIIPVNYRLDGETVVVRTDAGTTLHRAAQTAPVAFEVDEVDPQWEEGWSVVITGHAAPVTNAEQLERLRQLPLRPWAAGDKEIYLRIKPEEITGRRLV